MQNLIIAGERLREMLDYDPNAGVLTWKERGPGSFRCAAVERHRVASRWNLRKAGNEAGHINSRGYRVLCIERKTVQAHRIAWFLHYGSWPNGQIDHINRDPKDNRIENLRDATASENCRNRNIPAHNSSGVAGVHFHKPSGKWHARILDDGKRVHLGAFEEIEDAKSARENAERALGYIQNGVE